MQKEKRTFKLPMTSTFAIGVQGDKFSAHALDFDIVCVSDSEERAIDNLRLAVKTYIEYGLSKGWSEDILFPAQEKFWDGIDSEGLVKMLPPLEVDDRRMIVFRAAALPVDDEHRRVAC
ncbi:MAG: hypothetical protein ACREBQ_14260 [Nitrososphaerales archaeon]